MKKTFIFFAFVSMFGLYAYGQTEFSKSGAQWIIDYSWLRFGNCDYHSYSYTLTKDTILLSETWKILNQNDLPIGAFLEKGKKVYYYSFGWPEEIASKKRLFYDFSREKGDTIYFRDLYEYPNGNGCSGFIYENKKEAFQEEDAPMYDIITETGTRQGRKIIYFRGECLIEGIGSTSSFFDLYLPRANDYSSTEQKLRQVVAGNRTVYIQNQFVDSDYRGTFLKEGKKWYVKEASATGSYQTYELQSSQEINHFLMYPITCNGESKGYLYDVNGTICWYEGTFEDLKADVPEYNFSLSEGDTFQACIRHEIDASPPVKNSIRNYVVAKVDSIYTNGLPIKRIRLESGGGHAMTWLEGIGATCGPLYTFTDNAFTGQGNRSDWSNEVTCCYIDDELLYHHPDYKDCMETSIDETTQPSDRFEVNGNRLVLHNSEAYNVEFYGILGEPIYQEKLTGASSTINLEGLPRLLIGRITGKDGKTIILKILR